MSIDRKTFISHVAKGSGALLIGTSGTFSKHTPGFSIPGDFSVSFLATRWGYQGSLEQFCKSAREAGYNGVEVWLPDSKQQQIHLQRVLKEYQLEMGLLVGAQSSRFREHYDHFSRAVEQAVELQPIFINCHSGRDYFSFEQNKQIIEFTNKISRSTGVSILHETHRSRILYAAHITKQFLDQIPELRLTLDISHWCNVHESLLEDQKEAVSLALTHSDHVHARIGHAEGPQITDPRAPEWEQEVKVHFDWWDQVVKQKIGQGRQLTVTPEFGPPRYMPAVPYTGQPLANQWEINTYMMNLWKQRYS